MIDDRPPAVRGGGAFSALARDGLTHVELTWIEKKLEHWIRFGRVAQDRILTRRTRVVGFRPGAVFAFVRWASNDFGTIVSRIDVVRAVAANESYTTLPFVRPGGDILLKIEGWPKVQQVLAAIDAVEAAGHQVVKVITILDRNEGGSDKLRSLGYDFVALLSANEKGEIIPLN